MKKIFLKVTAVSFGLIFMFSACNNDATKNDAPKESSFNLDSVKNAIGVSNKMFSDAFAKCDSATFVSCYTSDACINPGNVPRMCGSQAIRSFFVGGYKMGIRAVKLTTEEVMGGKDAVAETGKYEIMGDNNASFDKGKYIVIWKQENGKWKMHRDEWNSDMPLPTTPAK